jgi:hypothetical protein
LGKLTIRDWVNVPGPDFIVEDTFTIISLHPDSTESVITIIVEAKDALV